MFKSKQDALTNALFLAITALNQSKAQECIEIAETIANSGMTLDQVTQAKSDAQEMAGLS
tara:strand:- start:255 stop:434 length:180 start_codon:yes stop_codon:yes gene_type:complete